MRECSRCERCYEDATLVCPDDNVATTPSIQGEPILDGRYRLEKRVGQGSRAIVYRARHIFLKTQHAIKIILPDLVGNDPNLVRRFRQEALAAAAVHHPNVVRVTDFGVIAGTTPFLVMEFIKGKSLQDLLSEEGKQSPAVALQLIQSICAGTAAAHRQNILHLDLKPRNIMIREGVPLAEGVKILNFGMNKIESGDLLGSFGAAQTTGLMGSPFYMAPEQWADESPDARADVYGLGVMLFEMLCGEVPFKGKSIPAILKKHLTAEVPPFASQGVDVEPQIEAVVRRALAKAPEHRHESAEDFLNALREAMRPSVQASSASAPGSSALPTFCVDCGGRVAETEAFCKLCGSVVGPIATRAWESDESMLGTTLLSTKDPDGASSPGSTRVYDVLKTRGEVHAGESEDEKSDEAAHKRTDGAWSPRSPLERWIPVKKEDQDEEEHSRQVARQRAEELVAQQAREIEENLVRLGATLALEPAESSIADSETFCLKCGRRFADTETFCIACGNARAGLRDIPRYSSTVAGGVTKSDEHVPGIETVGLAGTGPVPTASPFSFLGKLWRLFRPERSSVVPSSSAPTSKPAMARLPTRQPQPIASSLTSDEVSCSIFAPARVNRGQQLLVQVFAHLIEQAEQVRGIAKEFDSNAQRRGFLAVAEPVERGSTLTFELLLPELKVDEPVQRLTWTASREPQAASFGVRVPSDFSGNTVIGTVMVSNKNAPLGHIKFKLSISDDAERGESPASWTHSFVPYKRAFISYASADRKEVLKRVQMLELTGTKFFQDLLSLEPGERWERELFREIDQSDVFYLFWSNAAKRSEWVMKEVEYAIKRKGNDDLAPPEIVPVIIEGPPPVSPPPELAHLHFNHHIIYFMV